MTTAILCVHDNLTWLPEALSSIAFQNKPVDELILVKSLQTPAAADDLAQKFGARILLQPAPGLAAARNHGIAAAAGDLIAFLDSDDFWEREKTEMQTGLLEVENLDAVIGCLVRFPGSGLAAKNFPEGHFGEAVQAMTPGGLLVRKSVFEKIGCFDPRYHIACDHEWFMRLTAANLNIRKTADVVLRKRIHGGNLSNQVAAYRQEIMQVLKNRGSCGI